MFPLLKRIAFVASIPVLLAIGGWAQWSIFMTNPAPVDGPVAEAPRVEVARSGEQPIAAEPRIRPAPSSERPAAIGTAERVQPPAAPDELDTEFAQGSAAAPPEARIEPAPAPALMSEDTRQAALPATKENQSAREQEQERESRRAQEEAAEARKAAAAKREKADKADQAKQQGGGRPPFAYRDRPPFLDRDGISPREVRAMIRSRLEDMPARFGRPPWAR